MKKQKGGSMKKVFSYINTANKIFSVLNEIVETISKDKK